MTETIVFPLAGHDFIELYKLLKVTGRCASGGEAKSLIESGQAKVDGAIEWRKRCKLRRGQTVEFKACVIRVT